MIVRSEGRAKACAAVLAAFAFSAALLFGLATAHSAEASAQLKEIIRLAQAEGRIQIVSTQFGGADGIKIAEAGLKKMFGVDISIEFGPAPAMTVEAAKLFEEFQAGQKASSDIFAASAVQLGPYEDKGMYRKIAWAELMPDRISPTIVEAGGEALRVETQTPGILYNIAAAPWVKDVKVMGDLLKPDYHGKFYTTPYLAGFDVLLGDNAWGIDRTVDYIRKFSPQVGGFINCASEPRIASGEVPALALDCVGGGPNIAKYKGVLDLQIVSDAAQRRYIYITVPTNAAHANAAILYALYLLSPAGQRDVALNLDGSDLDSFADSAMGKKIQAFQARGVKFTTVDFNWWQNSGSKLQAPLRQIVDIVRQGR